MSVDKTRERLDYNRRELRAWGSNASWMCSGGGLRTRYNYKQCSVAIKVDKLPLGRTACECPAVSVCSRPQLALQYHRDHRAKDETNEAGYLRIFNDTSLVARTNTCCRLTGHRPCPDQHPSALHVRQQPLWSPAIPVSDAPDLILLPCRPGDM